MFNSLTLKQIFWKTKTFSKKLDYRFSVDITKLENATLPYKITLAEATAKTNRMGSSKNHEEERRKEFFQLLSHFFENFISTSYQMLIWCTNYWNVHIHTFRKCWSFIWGCFFVVSILKLDGANAFLSKIKISVSIEILRSFYFSIFEFYISCISLVFFQTFSTIGQNVILQKRGVRIINFQPRNFYTIPLFKQSSILKFQNKIC